MIVKRRLVVVLVIIATAVSFIFLHALKQKATPVIGWVDLAHHQTQCLLNTDCSQRLSQSQRPATSWQLPLFQTASFKNQEGFLVFKLNGKASIATIDYFSQKGANPITFKVDSVGDWELHAHILGHTMLEQNGDWVKLPKAPFPEPRWIHLRTYRWHSDAVNRLLTFVEEGKTYELDGAYFILVEKKENGLYMRPEPPDVSNCPDQDIVLAEPLWFPNEMFYDQNMHLKIKPAYDRGC